MSHAVAPHIDDVGQTEYSRRLFGFSPGKFAMWLFIGQDAMGFVGLLSTYIILRSAHPGVEWVPSVGQFGRMEDGQAVAGLPHLAKALTGVNTFILIVSSFTMVLALDSIQRG